MTANAFITFSCRRFVPRAAAVLAHAAPQSSATAQSFTEEKVFGRGPDDRLAAIGASLFLRA